MIQRVRVNSSQEVLTGRNDLLEAAALGVDDVLTLQGFGIPLSTGGYMTARTISTLQQETTDHDRGQVNINNFALDLVNSTTVANYPEETLDYILLGQDVYNERTNFVFGITWPTLGLSVQSIARVVAHTRDRGLQRMHTRHIARHEFAHMRGLNESSDYAHPDTREGIYQGHCTDICTMRQSMTVQEAIAQAKQLEERELAGFCTNCFKTLWSKRYD